MLNTSDYPKVDFSRCPDGYVDGVFAFAEKSGREKSLRDAMEWLNKDYFGEKCSARVFKDFALYSFYFSLVADDRVVMSGGIIYHGSHDGGGDGGAPTFSVNISPEYGWMIHT